MAVNVIIDIVRQLIEKGVYLYVDGSELKFRSKKGLFSDVQKK